MGIYVDGSIEVRVFTSEALERIKAINLYEEFEIPGRFTLFGNTLSYNEILKNSFFDPERIVKRITKVLEDQGTVSATYECEEDVPEAITYYYLGDGIKAVYFSITGDCEEDIYSRAARHAALLQFNSSELKEIYKEALGEDENPDDIESEDDLIDSILGVMDECVYEIGSSFFRHHT